MIKKKIVLVITGGFILGLFAFILSIIFAFTGNPISAAIANHKINDYIKKEYAFITDLDYKEKKSTYNFKFNYYGKYVQSKSSEDTGFYVYYNEGEIEDNYDNCVEGMLNTYSRLEEQFDDAVEKIIDENFPHKTDMVLANFYKGDLENGLKDKLTLDMTLDINNIPLDTELSVYLFSDEISYEALHDRLVEVHQLMKENNLDFEIYSIVIEEPISEDEEKPKHKGQNIHLLDFPTESMNAENLIEVIKAHQLQWEMEHEK